MCSILGLEPSCHLYTYYFHDWGHNNQWTENSKGFCGVVIFKSVGEKIDCHPISTVPAVGNMVYPSLIRAWVHCAKNTDLRMVS